MNALQRNVNYLPQRKHLRELYHYWTYKSFTESYKLFSKQTFHSLWVFAQLNFKIEKGRNIISINAGIQNSINSLKKSKNIRFEEKQLLELSLSCIVLYDNIRLKPFFKTTVVIYCKWHLQLLFFLIQISE